LIFLWPNSPHVPFVIFNQRPQKDVKLMVSNAVKYNKKTSPIVKGTSLAFLARMTIHGRKQPCVMSSIPTPSCNARQKWRCKYILVHVSSLPLNPPTDAHDIRKAVSDLLKENREKIDVCKPVGFGPEHSLFSGAIGPW
jgi:hypothetical protein